MFLLMLAENPESIRLVGVRLPIRGTKFFCLFVDMGPEGLASRPGLEPSTATLLKRTSEDGHDGTYRRDRRRRSDRADAVTRGSGQPVARIERSEIRGWVIRQYRFRSNSFVKWFNVRDRHPAIFRWSVRQ